MAYFRHFLGYLWSFLTRARKVKIAKNNLAVGSIGFISLGNISIWDVFGELISARDTFAEDNCIHTDDLI